MVAALSWAEKSRNFCLTAVFHLVLFIISPFRSGYMSQGLKVQSLITLVLLSLSVSAVTATALAQPPRRSEGARPPRQADRLQEGDLAPDFTLKSPDGKQKVTLSDFRGKKPVALVFGSYT
jgi:hypothetical protein